MLRRSNITAAVILIMATVISACAPTTTTPGPSATTASGPKKGGTLILARAGEVTNLEQSTSFRDRPIGSWYTSRRVIQGYTNQGQSLGAAIGPGSSSQWLAWDYLFPTRRFGLYAGRIRWNEDMRSVYPWPAYLEYCNHDVSYYVGFRGSGRTRFGLISADWSDANRINAFFQKQSTCSDNISQRDMRNYMLRLSFAPFSR